MCSHDTKLRLNEPVCVGVLGLTAQGLAAKYHGQRLFEAVRGLLIGISKLLPGGAD